MDHGKLAVLDLGEPGRQIGEKLFIMVIPFSQPGPRPENRTVELIK